jgi:hypothetical protein
VASPYSTGGGGTVLEHRYGAVLLAHLLTGDPATELGDDVAPVQITFQASAFSPVDDLVVCGRSANGDERRVSIGVRRDPSLVPSEEASVRLIGSYLRVVSNHWPEVQAGRWRLALAVASPNAPVQQVAALAGIAREAPDELLFRVEVARPGRTTREARQRLTHLDAVVTAAAVHAGIDTSAVPANELTWRLLSALRLRELRLEGVDEADRTATVGRLRAVTRDGTPAAADALFSRLAELAGRYAPSAAVKTDVTLRRDLVGTPLGRSPARARAWTILDRLAGRLRDCTGSRLADANGALALDRVKPRTALAAALTGAAVAQGTLVVLGEPDVGKSALTLRAAEELRATGIPVAALSLRDLPGTTAEFESLVGGALMDVLGGEAVDRGRLLVIDGAEAVLEGRDALLADLAAAALRAGLGVAAVTRTDAAPTVSETLRQAVVAVDPAGTHQSPAEHEVPRLSPAEVEQLTTRFASLARLGEEPRAAWLLGRPGLVDLLLRADATLALPDGALSEADVFAAIWHGLVRRWEITPQGGPSPDERERAFTVLARRLLMSESPAAASPEPAALPSLRSDGLLLAAGPTSAWNPGDQFASDLVRDLSVARLLLTEGWEVLTAGGAPRWTLRAARLACQATLAAAGPDTERARMQLQQVFDPLAVEYGARWAELPLEAMLTLGSAGEALAAAWPALVAGEREGVATLLRLALHRYSRHGVGDPVILAPLVELTCAHWDELGVGHRYGPRGGIGEQLQELVLAWLRGLVTAEAGTMPLRERVRDALLDADPEGYDEFAVEALALLGPDLDVRAEAFLRSLVDDGYLAKAVESGHAILALSASNPELLLALAEAYYVEKPRTDDPWWSDDSSLNFGVRWHTHTPAIGVPMAGWYLGPFFRLLNTKPVESLQMIHRLLDHAAMTRVGRLSRRHAQVEPTENAPAGLELDLPGEGTRLCIGDAHVWSWYRGSSVGPYPCMSALLAVERFADHLVDALGLPLQMVAEVLLRDCHNLAMPGLVVGLLVRHLDRVGAELDRWLTRPEVWNLEFSRAAAEFGLHVQGPDDKETVGRGRRSYTFREVAHELTVRAILTGEQERLAALHQVGDELLHHARELRPDEREELATVAGWAGALHAENYHPIELDGGRTGIQYVPPPEVTAGLAAANAELARGQQANRLQMTYAVNEDRSAPVETLADDLALARTFAADPPSHGFNSEDAVAGTAAAAIVAHAQGRARLAADDIRWAGDVLVEVALSPRQDAFPVESSIYPMGADRSAAVGLPVLLLPAFATAQVDRVAVERGVVGCATSLFDEVRRALAVGLGPVWQAPCDEGSAGGRCRHELAWGAVEAGLRDCQLGPWNQQRQRRDVQPLDGPPAETLRTVATDRLLVNRLTGPLVASADAARSGCCVAERAQRLLEALLEAHRRGAAHWATAGYWGSHNHQDHRRVAHVLLASAARGNGGPLAEHVRAFAGNAPALRQLLDDLSLLCTYDADLRQGLAAVWPAVMQVTLDAIDAGADPRQDNHWGDWAVASLIPHPGLDTGDRNPDATLEAANRDWIDPRALDGLIARWLPIARGYPRAVDALLGLVGTAPLPWQAATGLRWVDELIGGDYAAIASRCWRLPGWLEQLRASGQLEPPDTALLQRIVDSLVAHGDTRAVTLQRADE